MAKYLACVDLSAHDNHKGINFVPMKSKTLGELLREADSFFNDEDVYCVSIAVYSGEKIGGSEVYREQLAAWHRSQWRPYDKSDSDFIVVKRGRDYRFEFDEMWA